jgi:hypothetical protein
VVVLSYRTIFVIMGAVTLVASAYIVAMLRDQIGDDVRRPVAGGPEPALTGSTAMEPSALTGAPVEATVTES